MEDSSVTLTLMRLAAVSSAVATAVILAGCGKGGSTSSDGGTAENQAREIRLQLYAGAFGDRSERGAYL